MGTIPAAFSFPQAARNCAAVVYGERGANRKSGIAGGGLHEHFLKGGRVEDLSIRDAIERHASGQAQSFLSAALREPVPASDQNFLESGLHARGKIVVPCGERLFRLARRTQAFLEIGRKEAAEHGRAIGLAPAHFGALALMCEIVESQPE